MKECSLQEIVKLTITLKLLGIKMIMYVAFVDVLFMYILQVTGICGTSRFKAAKVSSKTMKNLDETGLVVAGCRHVIAQKAVNMFRGEL